MATMQDRRPRLISYSEIETALTCFARWDFSYGGRLAGSTLSARSQPPIRGDGRAWGAAVAAWHASGGARPAEAYAAMAASYDDDEAKMLAAGVPANPTERTEQEDRLGQMLEHYMATARPLPNLTRLEGQFVVPVPSRSGRRGSNRFRFLGYIDGYTVDPDDNAWIVEFKLRNELQPAELIMRGRQPRLYTWAAGQALDKPPMGVIVDERLNQAPKAPRVVGKTAKLPEGRPSDAKDQVTTPELYVALCSEMGFEPNAEVVDQLARRVWQKRTMVMLTPSEVASAGRELVSAAKLIRDLDSGELEPLRHATKMTCNGCRFKAVCDHPEDSLFVDSLFERGTPKRDRGALPVGSMVGDATPTSPTTTTTKD
jgi:hypothetical protein